MGLDADSSPRSAGTVTTCHAPRALLEAVESPAGEVVDLIYRDVNRAFCEWVGLTPAQQVGHSLLETFPGVDGSGLMARFADCAKSGEPVALQDFPYFNEVLGEVRYYDIHCDRVRTGLLSLTFHDNTDRVEAVERLADSEQRFRLLTQNASDTMTHVRDGKFVWVSPAVEQLLGAPPDYWIGRDVSEVVPPEGIAEFQERMRILVTGGRVNRRIQLVALDGTTHWVDIHSTPFFDAQGSQDGFTETLRLVDDLVAIEQDRDEALRGEVAADELYRRSMESASVGMCLASPEGQFLRVNQAICDFFGYDAEALLTKTWIELTAPEYLEADMANMKELLAGHTDSYQMEKQFVRADGQRAWAHLAVGCVRNPDGSAAVVIGQILDISSAVKNREQLEEVANDLKASEEKYRLLADNTADVIIHGHDGKFVWASPSINDALGAPAEYWVGREMREMIPSEDQPAFLQRITALEAGYSYQRRSRVMGLDGVTHWVHVHARPFYDVSGKQNGYLSAWRLIDSEVAAEEEIERERRQKQQAQERFLRLMHNAAIAMCIVDPDGALIEVNAAMCLLFGYDAETLQQMRWQELTAPEYLESDLRNVADVLEGRTDAYQMLKQYIVAGGHRIWGDLAVSCIRNESGKVESLIFQITDITAEVESRLLIAESEEQSRLIAERLRSEIQGAVQYVESILPGEMAGPVSVSSRYMPAQDLGGDVFHYRWIDDDHLQIYIIDVSGRGVQSALLSTSVHNLIRSGTLSVDLLLSPVELMNRLNELFKMEDQGYRYFTVWYGIYEVSTRTLRYACAGHPPATLFTPTPEGSWRCSELSIHSAPVGMFRDTVFTVAECPVPVGSRLLVFSDGAFELPLPDGRIGTLGQLVEIMEQSFPRSGFSLDRLVEELRSRTIDGRFDDDCSLLLAEFDD